MTTALSAPGVALRTADLIDLRPVALRMQAAPVLAPLPGGFATRRKGHGLEIADVRPYAAGDDIRHLDRGTTARTGRLHVREFQEDRDRVTLLIADFRPSMFWGVRRAFRSVVAAEALTLIGWSLVESGARVGLLALTSGAPVIVPPRGRVRGMLDVIGGLVRAHDAGLHAAQADDPPLSAALAQARRLAPAGAELMIASGFDAPGTDLPERLTALSRRCTPRLILISDAEAGDMPAGRYPIRLPDGRRLRVWLGGSEPNTGENRTIAGRPALVIRTADSIADTARRLASAFPTEVPR